MAEDKRDVSGRAVLLGAAAIICAVLLAALASYFLWRSWDRPPAGPDTANVPEMTRPTLQSAPQTERDQYFAEKQYLLDSYQWIDKKAGIARIPVEQAMQIMAARKEPR